MTKALLRLLLLLFLPSVALAQGVRVDNPGGPAQRNVQGFFAPIPGATITVCTSAATGTPCTPLVPTSPVTLCTDATCSTAAANPFTADSNGNFGFWALPGTYKVSVTGTGVTGYLLTVTLPCAQGISCLANPTTAAVVINSPGSLTVSGAGTFSGPLVNTGTDSGTQTISGAKTFSGGVTISTTPYSTSSAGSHSGTETFTGTLNCMAVNIVRCISPTNPQGWAGSELGAWLNAAQTNCGASCSIQVASGTYTLSTATSIGNTAGTNKVNIQLASGVTITASAIITIYADSSFVGPPSPIGTSGNVTSAFLQQANTSNLAALIQCGDGTNNGNGCAVGNLQVDGNKANNGTAGPNILINKSSRARIFDVTSRSSNSDGYRVTASLTGQESEAPVFDNIMADSNAGHGLSCINTNDGYILRAAQFENNTGNGLDLNNCSGWKSSNLDASNNTEGVKCYDSVTGGNTCSQNIIDGLLANNNSQQDIDIQGFDTGSASVKNVANQFKGFSLSGSGRRTNQTFDGILLQDTQLNVIGPGTIATGQTGSAVKFCVEDKTVSAGSSGQDTVHDIQCYRGATPLGDWSFTALTKQSNLTANNQSFAQYANVTVVTGALRAPQQIADQGAVCTNGELALSAGWQSTGSATVTAVAGNGQTCSWTITTGTTTAANPTVTDTLTNVLPAATTVCEMNIHGGTHTAAAGEGFQQTTLSATAPIFTFNGTPTAGNTTYFVTRRCGP